MKFLIFIFSLSFIFIPANSKEFRIDFSDEGMKLLKKRGFGKKLFIRMMKMTKVGI